MPPAPYLTTPSDLSLHFTYLFAVKSLFKNIKALAFKALRISFQLQIQETQMSKAFQLWHRAQQK